MNMETRNGFIQVRLIKPLKRGFFYCCFFVYFCYMITQILDNGNTLRLINESNDTGAEEIYDLEKGSGIKVKYLEQFDHIQLYDDARRIFFTITHKEVLEPVTPNTIGLYNVIIDIINTGIGVSINGVVNADIEDGLKVDYIDGLKDVFGRFVTVEPKNLVEVDHIDSINLDLEDELLENGGTTTLNTDKAAVDMSVTSTNGSRVVDSYTGTLHTNPITLYNVLLQGYLY